VPELYFDLARHFPSLLRDSRPEPPQRDGTDFTKIQNGVFFRSMIIHVCGGDCFCRDRTDWCSAPSFWPPVSRVFKRLRKPCGSHARCRQLCIIMSPSEENLHSATWAQVRHIGRFTPLWTGYAYYPTLHKHLEHLLTNLAFVHRESVLEREQTSTSTRLHRRFLVYHRSVLNPAFGKEVKARF
jgi:hypothetical protein